MPVKLAPFLQAFAGFALRAGHNDLFLHVPLYLRTEPTGGRAAHSHVHIVVYRCRSLLVLYLASFPRDTKLRDVQPLDWQVFGPVTEAVWLEAGAEQAVDSALACLRARLGCSSDAEVSIRIPAKQFPQIFIGTPIDLADPLATSKPPLLNLSEHP